MKEILLNKIKETIVNSSKEDVYAVSLYLEYYNDNVYMPTVTVSYNTNQNLNENIDRGIDPIEAKWNYAYWLQDELYVFGLDETKNIVREWFIKNNFEYMNDEEFFSNEINENLIEHIDLKIKEELVDIVKNLHDSGFIKEQFGKEIPVIIHELEYYEKILEINKKANPAGLLKEFEKFFF